MPPPASGLPPEFRPPMGYGGPVPPAAPSGHAAPASYGDGAPGLYGAGAPGSYDAFAPGSYDASAATPGQPIPYSQPAGYGNSAPGPYGSYAAPPPMAPQQWPPGLSAPSALQRPGVVGAATTMAATASAQWVCGLAFFWLLAGTGARQLGTTGMDGALFHLLNRFHYRMVDGLAWPLFLFPLASFALSFLLLTGRGWARVAFSAVGGAWLLWSAWLLRDNFVWWLPSAAYVATSVLLLWTASANRWFRQRSHPAGQPL